MRMGESISLQHSCTILEHLAHSRFTRLYYSLEVGKLMYKTTKTNSQMELTLHMLCSLITVLVDITEVCWSSKLANQWGAAAEIQHQTIPSYIPWKLFQYHGFFKPDDTTTRWLHSDIRNWIRNQRLQKICDCYPVEGAWSAMLLQVFHLVSTCPFEWCYGGICNVQVFGRTTAIALVRQGMELLRACDHWLVTCIRSEQLRSTIRLWFQVTCQIEWPEALRHCDCLAIARWVLFTLKVYI